MLIFVRECIRLKNSIRHVGGNRLRPSDLLSLNITCTNEPADTRYPIVGLKHKNVELAFGSTQKPFFVLPNHCSTLPSVRQCRSIQGYSGWKLMGRTYGWRGRALMVVVSGEWVL